MLTPKIRLVTAGFLMILGTPCYVACDLNHFCMAGHMKHPPYPLHEWVGDILWLGCYLGTAILSWRLPARDRRWLFYGSLALIVSRLLLEGVVPIIEPILLLLLLPIAAISVCKPGALLLPPEPGSAFRFHLSTLLVVVLVMGALIGLNLHSLSASDPAFVNGTHYGWPASFSLGKQQAGGDTGRGREYAMLFDLTICLLITAMTACATEWWSRKRGDGEAQSQG